MNGEYGAYDRAINSLTEGVRTWVQDGMRYCEMVQDPKQCRFRRSNGCELDALAQAGLRDSLPNYSKLFPCGKLAAVSEKV